MAQSSYAAPASPLNGLEQLGENFSDYFKNFDPQAGFFSFLRSRGLFGEDPTSRFAQNRFGNYYGQYLGQAGDNPNEGFYDFLKRSNFNPQAEYQQQSPEQRNDFTSRFLTPRARWVNR